MFAILENGEKGECQVQVALFLVVVVFGKVPIQTSSALNYKHRNDDALTVKKKRLFML